MYPKIVLTIAIIDFASLLLCVYIDKAATDANATIPDWVPVLGGASFLVLLSSAVAAVIGLIWNL
jgi:hypothetical protein